MSSPQIVSREPRSDHHVQFYEDHRFITEAVAEFFDPGIRIGQPLVLISTPDHRDQIYSLLASRSCDVNAALQTGQLQWTDARETLSRFMIGDVPDCELFTNSVGKMLRDIRIDREHLTIRAFGKMVDVLMRDGNPEGALQLEKLWNGLGPEYGFSLLCAYAIGNLYREEHWRYFQMVCDQHVKLPEEAITKIYRERSERS